MPDMEVMRKVLEVEAVYAESIENTLDVIRAAMENPASDMSEAVSGTCWLLSQVLHTHAENLRDAAGGGNVTTVGEMLARKGRTA